MIDIDRLRIRSAEAKRQDDQGVVTELALDGDVGQGLVFGRFDIEPDVDLPAHTHPSDTTAYCVEGSCSFRVGDDLDLAFEIGPGDYAYIPADTLHTEATGSEGVELVFARRKKPEATADG